MQMKKPFLTAAAAGIVASTLIHSAVNANTSLLNTPMSQETCLDRFDRSTGTQVLVHKPRVSDRLITPRTAANHDKSPATRDLLRALNSVDFETGSLSVTDCVGSSTTVRLRTRLFELDDIHRQGTADNGWRFSAGAENVEAQLWRRMRLELPPIHAWQATESGDGLLAEEPVFHPRNANDAPWYKRVRTTEVRSEGKQLSVVQTLTTNGKLDEVSTWTLR